ncbi:DUF7287 family protein [Methanocella arvoryzae]|uniref:Uncharacterized protein n=1 Tax=Methanocella arvoryzae (strain DSM 22066 / NBRC 105507 / MRE50) TaxID=351160 RepID=Q0W725_METAR|nr:hypothetical protein [Methanocella arvoryzae]CAJ35818.1 conserved hypothetical protein [Methanocella arvoryzae MRE50]
MLQLKNRRGQSNIDFLIGMGVFLLGFLYVLTFVPTLFTPYQPGAVDLSAVAYKTCAVLVEDPGWYNYTENDGYTSWELQKITYSDEYPFTNFQRFGLARDKQSPNVLSLDKVEKLQSIYDKGKYDEIRQRIGLAGTVTYDFNMDLVMTNMKGEDITLLNIDSSEPGDNMEKMQRYVQVDTGKQLFIDCQNPLDTSAKSKVLRVNLAGRPSSDEHDVIIRLYNAEEDWTISAIRGDETSFPMNDLFYQMDYVIMVNGDELPYGPMPGTPIAIGKGDTVEVKFFHETISANDISYLLISQSGADPESVLPGNEVGFINDPLYIRQSVCYPGTFTLEVWSDDLW